MFCKKCGFQFSDREQKCPFCGAYINETKNIAKNTKTEKKVEPSTPKYNDYVPYNQKEDKEEMNSLGYVKLRAQWWQHLLIACGGYILMYVLYSIISSIGVVIAKNNGVIFDCINDSTKACSVGAETTYYILSMVSQVLAEILIVVVVIIIFRKYLKKLFNGFKNGKTYKWFGIMLGIMYAASFVYSKILDVFNLNQTSTNQLAVTETIKSNPFLGFLFVVIAAPLFEEIIFRFGVFRAFTHRNKKTEIIGIAVTTFVFAFVHMIATIEEAIIAKDVSVLLLDLPTFPSYLIGAFCLTFAYYKSKNLCTTMIMHMSWNFLSFVSILLLTNAEETTSEIIRFITNLFI